MGQQDKEDEETQVEIATLAGLSVKISLERFRDLVVKPMELMSAGDRLWLIEEMEDVYCFGCGGPAKMTSGILCPCRNRRNRRDDVG